MKSINEFLASRKYARIGILLLSTLLITGASAMVYYSITSNTVATTATAGVKWATGPDCPGAFNSSPCGVTVGNAGTFAKLSISTYPNATVTYQYALNITNSDNVLHHVLLQSVSITGGQGAYSNSSSSIVLTLYGSNGTSLGTITYRGANGGGAWTTTTSGSTSTTNSGNYAVISKSTGTAGQSKWFYIQVQATADAAAAIGVTTTINLAADIQ